MAQSVKHKRSAVLVNGSPKLPTTSQLEVGEIAINFAEGHETLSTRNNNNGIATFSSDAALDKKYISSGAVVSAISAVTKTIEDNEYVIAQAFNDQDDRLEALEGAGFLTGYTETDPTVPAWAKASTKPTYTANEVGALPSTTHVPTEASIANSGFTKNALTAYTETDPTVPAWAKASTKPTYTAAEVGALSTATTYFDDVEYDSSTKRINFKKNSSVIDYVDATAFIKDGMVSSVTVSNGNLVVSFNTEAGREDITLALTEIFNPSNYYDKTTADGKFLTGFTETDPTVPSWAKQANKPTYTAAEVGAMSTSERSNYLTTATTIPTESTISQSGFTKNAITAINLNGNSVRVTDGSANIYGVLQTGSTVVQDGIPMSALGGPVNFSNLNIINGNNWDWLRRANSLDSDGIPVSPTSLQDDLDAKASTAHTHTAAEIGALPTGTTLDNIADGSTRKLSNYSLTSHTHSNYSLTSHTHTAAEVGALPSTTEIPTQASILSSGFTKNAGTLTGVTINGSAATVSNGNASFNIELGGSGSGLPEVTASDNGKILQVVDGQWTLVTPTVVYTGTDTPDNVLGNNGDIYIQTP